MDHYFRSTELFAIPNWRSDFVARHRFCFEISLSKCPVSQQCKTYRRCENAMSSNVQRKLITLVTSISNIYDLQNLPEWIQHHEAIGVQQFVVHNLLPVPLEQLRKYSPAYDTLVSSSLKVHRMDRREIFLWIRMED